MMARVDNRHTSVRSLLGNIPKQLLEGVLRKCFYIFSSEDLLQLSRNRNSPYHITVHH